MIQLLIAGSALQVLGFVLAARGFYRTWREHADGQDFWGPFKRFGRNVARYFRRLTWWRKRPQTINVGSVISTASVMSPQLTTHWGPLPDPSEDLAAFAAKVHERLIRLHDLLQEDQHALAKERRAREEADQDVRSMVQSEVRRVEGVAQHVAVGGLRWEVLGWSLLLIGLILVSVGSVGVAHT